MNARAPMADALMYGILALSAYAGAQKLVASSAAANRYPRDRVDDTGMITTNARQGRHTLDYDYVMGGPRNPLHIPGMNGQLALDADRIAEIGRRDYANLVVGDALPDSVAAFPLSGALEGSYAGYRRLDRDFDHAAFANPEGWFTHAPRRYSARYDESRNWP